jgi:hypothetical protein
MSDGAVPPPPAVPTEPQPLGFSGWLLLLAIGVCLSPIRTLVEFAQEFDDYGKVWRVPNGQIIVLTEVAINLTLLALEVVTMVAMLNRYRVFPKLFTWMWLAAFFLPLVDLMVTASLFPQVAGNLFGADFFKAMLSAIVRGLWVWYVLASVRVKNTFTK